MTSPITTHVLDTARGKPASGVRVTLEKRGADGAFANVARGVTDADGRVKDLLAPGGLEAATYRITFEIGAYHAALGVDGFYPEASIVFAVKDAATHHHVPLLVSPFGYSTYRGS